MAFFFCCGASRRHSRCLKIGEFGPILGPIFGRIFGRFFLSIESPPRRLQRGITNRATDSIPIDVSGESKLERQRQQMNSQKMQFPFSKRLKHPVHLISHLHIDYSRKQDMNRSARSACNPVTPNQNVVSKIFRDDALNETGQVAPHNTANKLQDLHAIEQPVLQGYNLHELTSQLIDHGMPILQGSLVSYSNNQQHVLHGYKVPLPMDKQDNSAVTNHLFLKYLQFAKEALHLDNLDSQVCLKHIWPALHGHSIPLDMSGEKCVRHASYPDATDPEIDLASGKIITKQDPVSKGLKHPVHSESVSCLFLEDMKHPVSHLFHEVHQHGTRSMGQIAVTNSLSDKQIRDIENRYSKDNPDRCSKCHLPEDVSIIPEIYKEVSNDFSTLHYSCNGRYRSMGQNAVTRCLNTGLPEFHNRYSNKRFRVSRQNDRYRSTGHKVVTTAYGIGLHQDYLDEQVCLKKIQRPVLAESRVSVINRRHLQKLSDELQSNAGEDGRFLEPAAKNQMFKIPETSDLSNFKAVLRCVICFIRYIHAGLEFNFSHPSKFLHPKATSCYVSSYHRHLKMILRLIVDLGNEVRADAVTGESDSASFLEPVVIHQRKTKYRFREKARGKNAGLVKNPLTNYTCSP